MALRESAAWQDLSSRGKIRVTGEDRARLLHAMTTNQVERLKPGEGCYVFFLNAQGRILGDANLFCFEDSLLLDTEPETRVKLQEHLDRYIIADDVTLTDETEATATIAVEGPTAASVLSLFGPDLPENRYSWTSWGARIVANADTTGAGGFLILLPASGKDDLISQLASANVIKATPEDGRIVRIERGRPRYGDEITERYLVQETAQTHAVSFNKGCYLGQEIVERVRSRAQIHRVLRRLELDTAEIPAAGTKLSAAGNPAAEIASAAFSPALEKTVALAYVRTPYAEPGTQLDLDGTRAIVEDV
ncbi:MAG TPA: glycine cleavage T C-terminal barrel domain-containing protein [Bryobacteraceae bacterium]|nr:glycine cleavage T C-terminal barrel domain-containing protein [Bryobacteraceae bacterium]